MAKIEGLESGKEGSGYEVEKKIQEYKDAYEALKSIKRREEAEVQPLPPPFAPQPPPLPSHAG